MTSYKCCLVPTQYFAQVFYNHDLFSLFFSILMLHLETPSCLSPNQLSDWHSSYFPIQNAQKLPKHFIGLCLKSTNLSSIAQKLLPNKHTVTVLT